MNPFYRFFPYLMAQTKRANETKKHANPMNPTQLKRYISKKAFINIEMHEFIVNDLRYA